MNNKNFNWGLIAFALIVAVLLAATAMAVTYVSPLGYSVIQEEGLSLTSRAKLNFIGSGITCVDSDPETNCTLTGGGGGDSLTVNGVPAIDPDLLDADIDWILGPLGTPLTATVGCTDCVALPGETTGNYVADITAPVAGITVSGTGVENATAILALADDLLAVEGLTLTGTIVRTATSVWTAIAPINDAVYIGSNGPDWTTSVVPDCVTATSALQYTQSSGVFSCGSISGGSGDNISVNGVSATDANFIDGDIDFTLDTGPSPDTISATVACSDCVALGTETTGAYVADLTGGAGITVSGGGSETANITVTTASNETDFLISGALTCGAGTRGRIEVHTTPLQYCDDSGTPTLRYAAYGNSSGESTAAANDSVALATDTTGAYTRELTGGDGITVSGGGAEDAVITVTTASSETNFLISGALTCGASTQGKIQVHTTPLQYCDNAGTPTLRYAAYGDSAGNATGLVCTGCVETIDIADSNVTEAKLDAIDSPGDEECLTWELTGDDFEWQSCGAGGSGDNISVNGVAATDANFSDTTPVKPSASTAGHFQKDSATPNNISVNILPWEITFTSFGYLSGTITTSPTGGVFDNFSPTGWNDTQPAQATIIRVTPLTSTIITGLAGGINGRLVIILNALDGTLSTGRLLILTHEGATSTAINRFTFADRMVRFILPGDSISLWYDAVSQRWREFPRRSSWTDVFTDYCDYLLNDSVYGGDGVDCSSNNAVSTNAGCQISAQLSGNATAKPIGVAECNTGTTAIGGAFVFPGMATDIVPVQGQAIFLTRVYIANLSTSAQRFQVYAGFSDTSAVGTATDGLYWLYDEAVSANWRICTADAATRNCSTTGLAVQTANFVWLGIYVYGDWSNATFFHSTDQLTWTFPTPSTVASPNGPEAADVTGISVGINKTVGTTGRSIFIDLLAWRYDFTRG